MLCSHIGSSIMKEGVWWYKMQGVAQTLTALPNIPPCVLHTAAAVRMSLHIWYTSKVFLAHACPCESQILLLCQEIIHSPDTQTFHLHVGCNGWTKSLVSQNTFHRTGTGILLSVASSGALVPCEVSVPSVLWTELHSTGSYFACDSQHVCRGVCDLRKFVDIVGTVHIALHVSYFFCTIQKPNDNQMKIYYWKLNDILCKKVENLCVCQHEIKGYSYCHKPPRTKDI